jgi:hypothetical protein
MDLAKIDLKAAAEEGIEIRLQHPSTGEYLTDENGDSLTITMLGKDSSTWQNAAKRVNARNANRYKGKTVPSSAMEAALYEILAESTLKWSKNIDFEGAVLKCTRENASMLYEQRNWIAEQVMEGAGERANYVFTLPKG